MDLQCPLSCRFKFRYAGIYEPDGRQFIIVCGNINYESVVTFLNDFFHPARLAFSFAQCDLQLVISHFWSLCFYREDVDVEVIFLNKNEPDLEFEGLLKREHTRVNYFK